MKKRTPYHKRFVSAKQSLSGRCFHATFVILVFGVYLSGCSGLFAEAVDAVKPDAAAFTFEPYDIATGPAKRQTVLTGFLLGGPVAELAVVHIDENGARRLRLYAFGEGTWVPTTEPHRVTLLIAR